MKALQARLDRLDGGDLRNVQEMPDRQLDRLIVRGLWREYPADQYAMSTTSERDATLQTIVNRSDE